MNILKKMTDEQLVNAYMEGNDNAFDVLLERHKDRLYSYILYHTNLRSQAGKTRLEKIFSY